MGIEIEYRYLLKPDTPISELGFVKKIHITQFYFVNDKVNHRISRCRRRIESGCSDSYVMTHKKPHPSGSGSVEIEHNISACIYNELLDEMLVGDIIDKDRYVFRAGQYGLFLGVDVPCELMWEVDVFPNGEMIAELEVPSRDYQFEVPSHFGKCIDITGMHEYSNSSLAENGWPVSA